MTLATVRTWVEGFSDEPTGALARPVLCRSAASASAMSRSSDVMRSVLSDTTRLSSLGLQSSIEIPILAYFHSLAPGATGGSRARDAARGAR